MKKIAIVLMIFCVGITYAQESVIVEEENTRYEANGDLVEVTLFHDNGQVEQHGFFKDKKLHGTWNYYTNEGQKVAIGTYDHGVKTGKWFFWNDTTLKEVDFQNQKIVSINEWKDKTLLVSK